MSGNTSQPIRAGINTSAHFDGSLHHPSFVEFCLLSSWCLAQGSQRTSSSRFPSDLGDVCSPITAAGPRGNFTHTSALNHRQMVNLKVDIPLSIPIKKQNSPGFRRRNSVQIISRPAEHTNTSTNTKPPYNAHMIPFGRRIDTYFYRQVFRLSIHIQIRLLNPSINGIGIQTPQYGSGPAEDSHFIPFSPTLKRGHL